MDGTFYRLITSYTRTFSNQKNMLCLRKVRTINSINQSNIKNTTLWLIVIKSILAKLSMQDYFMRYQNKTGIAIAITQVQVPYHSKLPFYSLEGLFFRKICLKKTGQKICQADGRQRYSSMAASEPIPMYLLVSS